MSLEFLSASNGYGLNSDTHPPTGDREGNPAIVAAESGDKSHSGWESAWIDLGGEG